MAAYDRLGGLVDDQVTRMSSALLVLGAASELSTSREMVNEAIAGFRYVILKFASVRRGSEWASIDVEASKRSS